MTLEILLCNVMLVSPPYFECKQEEEKLAKSKTFRKNALLHCIAKL